jgi:hypothetical protein
MVGQFDRRATLEAFNAAAARWSVSGITQSLTARRKGPQNQGSSWFCDWLGGSQNMSHSIMRAALFPPRSGPSLIDPNTRNDATTLEYAL